MAAPNQTFVVYRNQYGFLSQDDEWNHDISRSRQFPAWEDANMARLRELDRDPGNTMTVSVLEWT